MALEIIPMPVKPIVAAVKTKFCTEHHPTEKHTALFQLEKGRKNFTHQG
jgi:hypothetical protein